MYLTCPATHTTKLPSGRPSTSCLRLRSYSEAGIPGVSSPCLTVRTAPSLSATFATKKVPAGGGGRALTEVGMGLGSGLAKGRRLGRRVQLSRVCVGLESRLQTRGQRARGTSSERMAHETDSEGTQTQRHKSEWRSSATTDKNSRTNFIALRIKKHIIVVYMSMIFTKMRTDSTREIIPYNRVSRATLLHSPESPVWAWRWRDAGRKHAPWHVCETCRRIASRREKSAWLARLVVVQPRSPWTWKPGGAPRRRRISDVLAFGRRLVGARWR